MARSICQERQAAIEKELSAIADGPITVSFYTSAAATAPAAGRAADFFATDTAEDAPAPTAAPAKTSRLERNDVLNDPAVKMVLLGLNATPINIEKVEAPAPDPDTQLEPEPEETSE